MSLLRPRVLLLCQFGQPPRGLSPYGDALLKALRGRSDLAVEHVDYSAPYPSALHLADLPQTRGDTGVHWRKPSTWRVATTTEADILHIQHWLAPMGVYLARIASHARRNGASVVVTVHNASPHESIPWATSLESPLLRAADLLLVHDQRSKDLLSARLGSGVEIAIVPHGIECAPASRIVGPGDHELLGLDPNRRYACIFGNLRGYKGLDVLLQAWKDVSARNSDIDLIIAGRFWSGGKGLGARVTASLLGSARPAQRVRALLSGPELRRRVHLFEGFIPDEKIDALLRLATVAVFPYIKFGSQSGAACRAAGAGCPIIVSDVGGMPDLAIDRDHVVPAGDVAALVRALERQLPMSGAERARQLEHAGQFAWSHVAAAHAALYRAQVERRNRKH